jgi:hypothetical protein
MVPQEIMVDLHYEFFFFQEKWEFNSFEQMRWGCVLNLLLKETIVSNFGFTKTCVLAKE